MDLRESAHAPYIYIFWDNETVVATPEFRSEMLKAKAPGSAVSVSLPSRIHCGLINESGMYGRVDGGIGFALTNPRWELLVGFKAEASLDATADEQVIDALNAVRAGFADILMGREIFVRAQGRITPHIGLGSKTALLMGLGRAVCALTGTNLADHDISTRVGRGGTSGIGISTSLYGGVVWDAGHKFPSEKRAFGPSSAKLASPARALCRFDLDWLQVVHFRFRATGIHGTEEIDLFSRNCPVNADESVQMLQAVAWGILPAIAEKDDIALHSALFKMQSLGFKRVEWDAQDEVTKDFRRYWESLRVPESLGISSVGPTLYILTRRPAVITDLIFRFGPVPTHCENTTIDNVGIRTTRS